MVDEHQDTGPVGLGIHSTDNDNDKSNLTGDNAATKQPVDLEQQNEKLVKWKERPELHSPTASAKTQSHFSDSSSDELEQLNDQTLAPEDEGLGAEPSLDQDGPYEEVEAVTGRVAQPAYPSWYAESMARIAEERTWFQSMGYPEWLWNELPDRSFDALVDEAGNVDMFAKWSRPTVVTQSRHDWGLNTERRGSWQLDENGGYVWRPLFPYPPVQERREVKKLSRLRNVRSVNDISPDTSPMPTEFAITKLAEANTASGIFANPSNNKTANIEADTPLSINRFQVDSNWADYEEEGNKSVLEDFLRRQSIVPESKRTSQDVLGDESTEVESTGNISINVAEVNPNDDGIGYEPLPQRGLLDPAGTVEDSNSSRDLQCNPECAAQTKEGNMDVQGEEGFVVSNVVSRQHQNRPNSPDNEAGYGDCHLDMHDCRSHPNDGTTLERYKSLGYLLEGNGHSEAGMLKDCDEGYAWPLPESTSPISGQAGGEIPLSPNSSQSSIESTTGMSQRDGVEFANEFFNSKDLVKKRSIFKDQYPSNPLVQSLHETPEQRIEILKAKVHHFREKENQARAKLHDLEKEYNATWDWIEGRQPDHKGRIDTVTEYDKKIATLKRHIRGLLKKLQKTEDDFVNEREARHELERMWKGCGGRLEWRKPKRITRDAQVDTTDLPTSDSMTSTQTSGILNTVREVTFRTVCNQSVQTAAPKMMTRGTQAPYRGLERFMGDGTMPFNGLVSAIRGAGYTFQEDQLASSLETWLSEKGLWNIEAMAPARRFNSCARHAPGLLEDIQKMGEATYGQLQNHLREIRDKLETSQSTVEEILLKLHRCQTRGAQLEHQIVKFDQIVQETTNQLQPGNPSAYLMPTIDQRALVTLTGQAWLCQRCGSSVSVADAGLSENDRHFIAELQALRGLSAFIVEGAAGLNRELETLGTNIIHHQEHDGGLLIKDGVPERKMEERTDELADGSQTASVESGLQSETGRSNERYAKAVEMYHAARRCLGDVPSKTHCTVNPKLTAAATSTIKNISLQVPTTPSGFDGGDAVLSPSALPLPQAPTASTRPVIPPLMTSRPGQAAHWTDRETRMRNSETYRKVREVLRRMREVEEVGHQKALELRKAASCNLCGWDDIPYRSKERRFKSFQRLAKA